MKRTTMGSRVALAGVFTLAPVVRAAPVSTVPPRSAQQQPAAATAQRIEVIVVRGTTSGGGSDPALHDLPQLARPPFSTYVHQTVVSRSTVSLGDAPSTVSLPGGDSVTMHVTARQPNGRVTVSVELNLGGHAHTIQFAAAPGDPFFSVRSTGADSALILGFVVR